MEHRHIVELSSTSIHHYSPGIKVPINTLRAVQVIRSVALYDRERPFSWEKHHIVTQAGKSESIHM